MRKIGVAGVVLAALAGAPAFAQDSGFYVGADIGAVVASETDQEYTPGGGAGTTGSISTEHKLGLTGAAFVGYDFGAVRVEAEAGFLSADIDELNSSFSVGALAAGSQGADGEVKARTVMANALVDIGGFEGFAFFIGGGAGVAELEVSGMAPAGGFSVLDDDASDWTFAWQAIAGISMPLSGNIDLHARYRYLNVDETDFTGFGGRAVTADLTAHLLTAGVTYRF